MGLISLMRKPFSPPPSGRGMGGLVIWPILVSNMTHIGEYYGPYYFSSRYKKEDVPVASISSLAL